ncbi:proline-rich protein 4-like [Dorcoceras hygrometricum]|uniref:Proline-rich protein 4-like n=1 Tax=Dorcoceras hygrometricum TaxID=472368 RepID=A0A2Z7D1M0_9LAMI|nr:proline-rich protein 4-like [Dorcoceras hygrometricum]
MRVHSLCQTALWGILLVSLLGLCSADDKTSFEVVGAAECADCKEYNVKTTGAFSGLSVSVDCMLKSGETKRMGNSKLDKYGKFRISVSLQLHQDCYVQLHSAAAVPCAAHNGVESTKIVLKSETNGIQIFGPRENLQFSTALCASKPFWPLFKHPSFTFTHPWKKSFTSWPPLPPFPPLHKHKPLFPPVVMPLPPPFPVYNPPVPVYKPKPPVYKPPVPVYKPPVPVYSPPVPVYKPKPPVYKPPVPVYKPPVPVYSPPVPVYKPPVPVYKPNPPVYEPPAPVYKPNPPVYEPPAPVPVYNPKPPVYEPPVPAYKPKPPVYKPPVQVYNPISPVYKAPAPIYKPNPQVYKPPAYKKPYHHPLIPKLPPLPKLKFPPKHFHHPKFGHFPPLPPYHT